MTKEQVEKKISYLRSQRDNPTGNYRRYLVNIYNLYKQRADENGTNWAPDVSLSCLVRVAYAGLDIDHSAFEKVKKWKQDLKNIGYIESRNVDGEWRVYILKELDF